MRNANKSLLKLADFETNNLESVIFLEQLWKNVIEIDDLFEKIVKTENKQEALQFVKKICATLEDEVIHNYQNNKNALEKIFIN